MDSDQKLPREEVSKDSDNEKIKLDTQLDNPPAENSAVETNGATECSTVDLPGLQKPKKKASGPRTPLGKATSSRNGISHGIFAAVLLPGESRSEYKKRYAAKRAARKPGSEEEERVIRELTDVDIRRNRLHAAEWATIRMSMEYPGSDQRSDSGRLEDLLDHRTESRLIRTIRNADVRKTCLELLSKLYHEIEHNGFRRGDDLAILEKIYGERDPNLSLGDLYDIYEKWQLTSMVDDEERARFACASPEQCRKYVLQEIDREIHRVETHGRLDLLCRAIPDNTMLDRLLRYSAWLDRETNRLLRELEDLQRARLGKPPLPKLEVRHRLSKD
jgi:hypothetical protein